jgi:hypothetical protein
VFDDSFRLQVIAIRIADMLRVTLHAHFKMTGFVTRLDALVTKYEEISALAAPGIAIKHAMHRSRLSETVAVTANAGFDAISPPPSSDENRAHRMPVIPADRWPFAEGTQARRNRYE